MSEAPKKKFHVSILVFLGSLILSISLWTVYGQRLIPVDSDVTSHLMLLMGTLFSAAAGLFVWSLETREVYLQGEVRKRTSELQAMNDELSRKNLEIENFTHTISHDLKAPLVSINGFAMLLKANLKDALSGDNADYMHRIIINVKQMSALIQDLLEFSRVGHMEDEKENVNMESLFDEILTELKPELERKKIQVKNEDHFLPLFGSRMRLHQVFSNLISNSVKYIGNSAEPTIVLRGRKAGPYFEIMVKDNGIGIPKESQHKVFQIFQRFHPASGEEGTGIGLSIVKKIVEINGGSVRFESASGCGTTFFVTWPMNS